MMQFLLNGYDTFFRLRSFGHISFLAIFDSHSLNYNNKVYHLIIKRFLVIGAGSGLRIDVAENVLIKESVFQNVCIGVSLLDRNLWNTIHSRALVTNVVFDNILKNSQCVPIVFEQVTVDDNIE